MRVARSAAADINFNAAMHEKALTATKIANGKGKEKERGREGGKEKERWN